MFWRRSKSRKPRRGRGALLSIAVLFLLSGVLRLVDGTGEAIAREVSAGLDQKGTDGEYGSEMSADMSGCIADPGLAAALQALQVRTGQIEAREIALIDRERAIEVAEAALDAKLKELAAAEESLLATVSLSETAAERDLERLTSVYENMKPKDAAVLFGQMAPEFAAGFLGRMRADAAAQILAGLEPETAYSISVLLAGRNARAPTE